MLLKSIELRRVSLPLKSPFRTSFGSMAARDALLVCVTSEEGSVGWSECVAFRDPLYSSEYTAGCQEVIERFLAPLLFSAGDLRAEEVGGLLSAYRGHPMAKAALEAAILDAQLKACGVSLATCLGANKTAVDCGVSVGIAPSLDALLHEVSGYVEDGYRRIKLKIEPGWDLEPVARVREAWPSMPLQVDANQAYTRNDVAHLSGLDAFHLLLIEQPLPEEDLIGHAELAKAIGTPVCLDESITSLSIARDAIALGATSIINIKPGRLGGFLEARRIHDFCWNAGIPVWCGGMLESGIGRAANLALAALPGFTLPGDTSASSRFYHRDITPPFVMSDGRITVPDAPGIGVEIDRDYLESVTRSCKSLERQSKS
jgi:O-succinylbenzoate synthase